MSNWAMVTFTYDSTNGLKGYVNGSLDASAAANGALNSVSGYPLSIGRDATNATTRDLSAKIDDVRVYNRALTSSDVSELYAYTGVVLPAPPTLTTSLPTLVSTSTLTLNANISSIGSSTVTQSGFAYGTSSSLTTGVSTTTLGAQSVGAFSQALSGLSPATTYYFRAYATNASSTGYGAILSTTTKASSGATVPLFVQSAQAGTYSNAATATFGSNVTAGDVIAVSVSRNYSGSATIADTCNTGGTSDTYHVLQSAGGAAIAYAVIGQSGSCAVTYTWASSGTSQTNLVAHEISGVDTSNPVDGSAIDFQNAYGDYTTTDSITSGSITTTASGDYIFGATVDINLNSAYELPGTGFTDRAHLSNTLTTATEDKYQASAGSIAATFTNAVSCSASCQFVTGVIAFTPLPVAGPPSILSFKASPASIFTGATSSLAWSISGATYASIDQGVGSVATSSGSFIVTPSGTTVYTLTASNAYGTTTATTSVALVPGSFVGPADIFLTMATSTPGTPLTIPILDDGTIGYPHWFQLESDGTTGVTSTPGLTVATSQHALPSSVEVGTTAYASTTATQSIALNDTYYYETAESYLPAGHPSATISGWLTVGPANAGVNGMT
ncbi:MAG: LamG domain-containing protein, partial [Euryarchaeota archaeon]|nr:LamG domain-containing protein [Euryarchaeota archaeon]